MNEPRKDGSGGLLGWFEQRLNVTELFSFLSHFGLVYTPVDTRRPLKEVLAEIDATPVTSYARWPHVLGVLAAILFGLEALTGLLLAYYYRPSPEAAFESTRTIVRDLPFGAFLHQMHTWGAYLLILVVAVRLIRLFWDGLYRAPRELLWFSAVGLMWAILQLDFTGRLLTWNLKSYWAAERGLEVVWALPLVGPVLSFLLGGRVMNEDVLIRFYVLHVAVLPMVYMAGLYLTFGTIRRVGLSASPRPAGERVTTFRQHYIDLLIITLFLFAGLVTLATLLPFHFHGPADPYNTPAGARPPWYMLAPYVVFQHIPGPPWIPGLVLLGLAIGVLTLPLWSRPDDTRFDEKRVKLAGAIAFGLWLLLSVLGAFLERR